MNVNWIKCNNNNWCKLSSVNLDNVVAVGVYVIWKPGNPSKAIRVGQGNIKDRLSEHRDNAAITKYGNDLLVTWATVNQAYLDGIERYLAERYAPLVGDRFPDVQPIAVNLP